MGEEKFNMAIAELHNQNGKAVGYRILNTDGKEGNIKDIPLDLLKKVLVAGSISVDNLAIVSDEIVGTQGSLDRLPTLVMGKGLVGKSSLTILNKIEDAGFTLCDHTGKIKKFETYKVVNMGKEVGLSNGKIVTKEDVEYVSAISGNYREEALPKRRGESVKIKASDVVEGVGKRWVGSDKVLKEDAKQRIMRGTVKSIGISINDEISFNDTLKLLDSKQRKVLQEYYLWWTVKTFEGLAGSRKLEVSPKKVEALAEIRRGYEWKYDGSILARLYTKEGYDYCSLGHKLTRVHFALGVDKNGNTERVKFGSTCSADFFNISPDGIRKLEKVTTKMADEIEHIVSMHQEKTVEDEWRKVAYAKQAVDRLGTVGECQNMFGERIGAYMYYFKLANIPFPESILHMALENIMTENKTAHGYLKKLFPESKDTLNRFTDYDARYSNIGKITNEYFEFMRSVALEGKYAYDPIAGVGERGQGRFTASAKARRKYFLTTCRSHFEVTKFDLVELQRVVKLCDYYRKIGVELASLLDEEPKYSRVKDRVNNQFWKDTNEVRRHTSGRRYYTSSELSAEMESVPVDIKKKGTIAVITIKALWFSGEKYSRDLPYSESTNSLKLNYPGYNHLMSLADMDKLFESIPKADVVGYLKSTLKHELDALEEVEVAEREKIKRDEEERERLRKEREQLRAQQEQAEKKVLEDLQNTLGMSIEELEKYDQSKGLTCPTKSCEYNINGRCKVAMAIGNFAGLNVNNDNEVTRCILTPGVLGACVAKLKDIKDGKVEPNKTQKYEHKSKIDIKEDPLYKLRALNKSGILQLIPEKTNIEDVAIKISGNARYRVIDDLTRKQKYVVTHGLESLEENLAELGKRFNYDTGNVENIGKESLIVKESADVEDGKAIEKKDQEVESGSSNVDRKMGDMSDGNNVTYYLTNYPSIQEKLEKVVDGYNKGEIEADERSMMILENVLDRGKFSDKQYKYMKSYVE